MLRKTQSINQSNSLFHFTQQENIQIFPLWEMRVPIHLIVEGFKKIDTIRIGPDRINF